MPVRALMLDVDGVLVDGRPEDGRHWQTSLEADLGLSPAALREHFFAPYWDEIVTGRVGLMAPLHAAFPSSLGGRDRSHPGRRRWWWRTR